jgi:PilZ domain-containing protein
MQNAVGAPLASFNLQRKNAVRAALFELSPGANTLITDCFRQFGIEAVRVNGKEQERLRREKFDACVLPLGPTAGAVLEAARNSASNSRVVIYGLGGSARDSIRYSKYCINAVFHEPLERSAVLKLVRSTRPLVLHEYRRYVRVPVITEVSFVSPDGGRFTATSQEVSSGGMSLKGHFAPESGAEVEVSFSLLTLPRLWVRGHVSWRKPDNHFGVRFDSADNRRRRIKEWIDGYLES